MQGRDIIAIGASVGGVEALSNLVTQFPEDLAATIVVVQHISPTATGQLAQILDRAGPLPAAMAQDGESFELGHIYVAPPDHHLLVKQDCLRVTRGLRENRVRPAIDPLFRSAAMAYGAPVIGRGRLLCASTQNGGDIVSADPGATRSNASYSSGPAY